MTCIAALARDGRIAMAGDSRNNVHDRPIIGAAAKVRHRMTSDGKDQMLFGVSGDGALMVLVRDRLHVDEAPKPDADPHPWADAVAIALTELALEASIRDQDGRLDGSALLGWNGRLWTLTHMQAIPHPNGVAAIGSGSDYAIGVMSALAGQDLEPAEIVTRAVACACEHDPWCAQPIDLHLLGHDLEPVG